MSGSEWARRTVRNWRWWVVLPLVPFCLLLIVAQHIVRLMAWTLANTEQESHRIFNWARRGWKA